ncbi:nitrate/sulfonate/bicarbonate ABC transporter ATP-binding protein [Acetobacter estunensis NRIC 0472]|uniref:ATP-binding cassette domain-containing protein n=1 Tax=Acetobacter estunensis TaxID=104097 RepID=A0A967B3S4_9PROT|nr:ABC transporter ATP-binding protein [Acetobacter estunensis]NHO52378.1 ATP-binding cassette domain-containing protein [Acetobacter estunensis]GBQ25812.1 nitrate/sulfonate/bicarbonate ABC transporter ATP-binding protein [Acetobacter estunensis NRIC 0472]
MEQPSPYLQFQNVTKCFGDVPVVQQPFNLAIPAGQFTVFLGPSGCGKTTLMRMIGGLDTPSSGEILLQGAPVGEPDIRRGMVFQSYSSFPWLTVRKNIEFGMRFRRDLSVTQKKERAEHFLKLVGLGDFASSYPSRISGGMRQRVAIARTLAANPDVLLMDEPFGALDANLREDLQFELRKIQKNSGKTTIFVTHDVEEAVFLADRIIVFGPRPARVIADVDVTSLIGPERNEDVRDSERFFHLRTEILHLLRGREIKKSLAS